jgi:FxsC-like protein
LRLSNHRSRRQAVSQRVEPNIVADRNTSISFTAQPRRMSSEWQDAGLDAYGESGGSEWQPFFPNEQRAVGAVAPQVAGSDEIGMIPHEMPLSQDLDAQVRRCEANRQIVVLFLDSWTLKLIKYRQVRAKLDQQNYINCAVLIPWNDADEETVARGRAR